MASPISLGFGKYGRERDMYQKTSGSSDTDYNQLQLNVYFQMSWENIERYCKKPDAEVCY